MRCKQFIIVSLAGVVLAASLAGCGTSSTAPSAGLLLPLLPLPQALRLLPPW